MKLINNLIIKKTMDDRERVDRDDAERIAAFPMPEGVERIDDVPYIDDGKPYHLMHIYRPKQFEGSLPVILNIHGGGLMFASRDTNRNFCAVLAEMGFLVFSSEYPLIPEVKVYEQYAAVLAAMDAVDRKLEIYGGDRNRVYMVGDSAGGYLVTYANAMCKSPAMAAAAGVRPSKLNVRALGLIGGMFYTRVLDKSGVALLSELVYGRGFKRSAFAEYTDPENPEICAVLPPCFMLTAHADFLRPYTLRFAGVLKAYGREYELMDMPEELEHVFNVLHVELEESRRANRALADFLLKH